MRDVAAGWIAGLVVGLAFAWWWGNVYLAMSALLGGIVLTLTVWTAVKAAGTSEEGDQ